MATVRLVMLCVLAAAATAAAAPDGNPVRIETLGNWRTHDPVYPASGAEPWTPADVAGFLARHPNALMELGYRDGYPAGDRYWLEKGREVDQLQALLVAQGIDGLDRICVTERPDVLARMVRPGGCGADTYGGGCDWEGDMDGSFGELEQVVKHAGVVSGGSETGLEDRNASWSPATWRHRLLVLRPGRADEERRRISANGSATLEVTPPWTQVPSAGERYEIRGSFDPAWVKSVPRAVHERVVRELWTNRRNVCGPREAPTACPSPAEPLDPLHPANRRSWPNSLDRNAIMALATPSSVPAIYGSVADPASPEAVARHGRTDPHLAVAAVVMDVADPAYREWRIRYLMYKLQDYGISPGEPACISLAYKPGWYTHYDETSRGPSGDRCAVSGSGLWTGPAHVCSDGSAPGGPMASGLYGPGQYERAINAYIRELIATLADSGWSKLKIMTVERPTFTVGRWSILDEDVRRHPVVLGEWAGAIEPMLAELGVRSVATGEAMPPAAANPAAQRKTSRGAVSIHPRQRGQLARSPDGHGGGRKRPTIRGAAR